MSYVELDLGRTPLSPERVIGALTDFSPRRPEIWPNLHPSFYEVYSLGDTWAEVKEGSQAPGMTVWAIEDYDWSVPGTVSWTIKESNLFASGGSVSARIDSDPDGGSRMRVAWNRGRPKGSDTCWDYQAERRQAGSSLDQTRSGQDPGGRPQPGNLPD